MQYYRAFYRGQHTLIKMRIESTFTNTMNEIMRYFLGVLQADPGTVRDYSQIFRLFCHEAQRVFHDRLINHEDKKYFNTILAEMSQKHFSQVT